METVALQNMEVLYTKHRLNPWKLKNLPFMSQPMMLLTLDIATNSQGLTTVAIVGTMNLYFTKFTAFFKCTTAQHVNSTVSQGLMQCFTTFFSKHQRHPQRLFLMHNNRHSVSLDLSKTREQLSQTNSILTYV